MLNTTEVSVKESSEGDVIAADIYNENGIKLISKDTVINFFIKEHLYEHGIESIKIYGRDEFDIEPDEKYGDNPKFIRILDYYKKSATCIKNVMNDLSTGKKLDNEKIIFVSDLIYQYVNDNDEVLHCIELIGRKDENTYSHSINTAFYSMLIAKWLGYNQKNIKRVVQAGLLHDIGKTRIPPEILNKKTRLTREEFQIIKKHPIYGYYILDEGNIIDIEIKRVALLHHERLDRTGYPFCISSESIGLFAKIVSIADVYDAMTSNRVYKQSVNPFNSFEMFLTEGLRLFDRNILCEFISHVATYFVGSKVILNTGQSGKIVHIPPNDVLSPIVLVENSYINLGRKKEIRIERIL